MRLLIVCLLLTGTCTAHAGELMFRFTNPAFGGPPSNGPYLLSNAQAQDQTKKSPAPRTTTQRSSLDRFTDLLESRLLNQLLTDISDGNTGSLVTDDFTVNITGGDDGGLNILITDRATGETTEIGVNGLSSPNP